MQIPRAEYPRPQFTRESWLNLNGEWQFEIDNAQSGEKRGLQNEGVALQSKIVVPFCPESKLSGVGHTDFMFGVWYKRTVTLDKLAERTLLHFGAVDYHCKAFVNGTFVGEHKGGYVSFSFDITAALREGENEIAVFAADDTRSLAIPSGKQSDQYESYGCLYTRTTGIWQTVWLEFTPQTYIDSVKYYPNITDGSVTVEAALHGIGDFACRILFDGKPMADYATANAAGRLIFTLPLAEKHLWEVGKGNLYDVEFSFGDDSVKSYFGLREVRLDGHRFLINGKSVFQRLILDQGFYPDGIYTAPTDADLVRDIELSLALGFNGARPHEKIFEERYLYHADRMGYIVWGEYPDWGIDYSSSESVYYMLPEWIEEMHRDFNHPSIVGWCPHNETYNIQGRVQHDGAIEMIYNVTKALDSTRPCIDTSGGFHVKTDIFCQHDYTQDPAIFKKTYDQLITDDTLPCDPNLIRYSTFKKQTYRGEATFLSEYGGIAWTDKEGGWGYGQGPQTLEEFYERYKGLTDVLLDNYKMFGLCYTQLTDVEQEQNGLYTYDRKPKFDQKRLFDIMSRKAAIED